MVRVKEINWMSKEALEAKVIITDGQFELLCFSHPLEKKKGEQLTEPLYALDSDKVVRLETPRLHVEKLDNTFDYLIEGKLIDKEAGHVRLGEIIIEIGSYAIPGDLEDGDYISFICHRLDI